MGDILEELLGDLLAKDGNNSEYGMDNMSAILIKFNRKWSDLHEYINLSLTIWNY